MDRQPRRSNSRPVSEELVVLLGPTRVPQEDELQSILTPSATIPTNRLTPLLWDCEMARNDDSLDADGSEWSRQPLCDADER